MRCAQRARAGSKPSDDVKKNFGNDERAKSVVDKLDEHGARFASGELDPWYLRLLLINRLLAAKKPGGGGVRPIGSAMQKLSLIHI